MSKAGESLTYSGILYTARDAAFKAMQNAPLDEIRGAFIYFAGPTGAPQGYVTGSIGPTTSGRMERYLEWALKLGVKGFIGKGALKPAGLFKKYGALYLCAVGGAGALYAGCIKSAEVVAYPELGCEAVRRLEVANMPLICGIDSGGNSLFEQS